MKWQIMSKKETGYKDILFVDLPLFKREIEIHTKKNGYLVMCYHESLAEQKLLKTLSAAKLWARKWLVNEINLLNEEVKFILEGK